MVYSHIGLRFLQESHKILAALSDLLLSNIVISTLVLVKKDTILSKASLVELLHVVTNCLAFVFKFFS